MSNVSRAFALCLGLALLAGSPALSRAEESTSPGGASSRGAAAAGGEVRIPEHDEWCRPCPLPPIPVPRPGKDTGVLALRRTEVRAQAVGPVVEVEVVQHYHNPSSVPITVGYTFPLPADAAVRSLDVVTGDRRLRGEVRATDEARRIYEEASQAGHGAVLVEQRRGNVFRALLANVLPGAEVAVRIRYVQTLTYSSGQLRFQFPTVVAPRYCPSDLADASLFDLPYVPSGLPGHAIDIRVRIAGASTSVASPSHPIAVSAAGSSTEVSLGRASEVPNRDFVLSWRPSASGNATADAPGGEPDAELWIGDRSDAGTPFLLVAWPTRRAAEPARGREVVFILDSSGSMSGAKWATAVRAVKGFLRGLGGLDTIRLVEFDSDWSELDPRALPFNQSTLDRADAWLDGLRADEGTEILRPLEAVLKRARDPERDRIVLLLTDGQVGNEDQVLEAVRVHGAGTRIHTLGIDYAVNDGMLRGIARRSGGTCLLMTPDEDVEGAILALTRRFTAPIATGIEVRGGSAVTYPATLPDLFAGEPLVVSGRFTGSVPDRVSLAGLLGRDPWRAELLPRRIPASGIDLDAVVARAEIQSILDASGREDAEATRRRVVPIALAHGLSSPWTSFVVVERREVKTDTGLVREVEVPVAFPHGWDRDAVLGPRAANGRAMTLGRAAGALFQAAVPTALPMAAYDGKVNGGGEAAAEAVPVTAEVQARRYLVRQQRADGAWQVGGRNDARTTAVALLGLLPEPAAYEASIRRAASHLSGLDLTGEDEVTRGLVKAALTRAATELGEPSWSAAAEKLRYPAASPTPEELSRLGASDDAGSLATLVLATARNITGAEHGRTLAATRLVGRVERGGALAGVVSQGGSPSLPLTAITAALAR